MQAEDVFYVNTDDSYKGLFTKSKIARQYGFHMISPAEPGSNPKEIITLLNGLADGSDATGKVFVLDTLKKFADMMSKSSQAELYTVLRRLVAKNATVILVGHTNKHPDGEGNLIYEGTSDTLNDVDCAYAMYRLSEPEDREQIIEFRREKSRGDVVAKVSYGYTTEARESYHSLLDSVHMVDDVEASSLSTKKSIADKVRKYESEILFVEQIIGKRKKASQSEILNAFTEKEEHPIAVEFSRRSSQSALKQPTGIKWSCTRGEKNMRLYELLDSNHKNQEQLPCIFE